MKRFVILVLTFLTFLFILTQFSSAQSCASADDTILRLNSPTNAHGQTYDQTQAYTTGICYSAIFGQPAPANPSRTCSGSGNGNRIVRLSHSNNAHAEIPDATSPAYTTEICYQGLTCQSVAGNVACPTGKQEVLQLSGATNAHLETASGTAYTTANNYKICCSAGTITGQAATWKNLDGTPVISSPPNPVCINRYVVAHTQASGFANGEVTSWELWEKDLIQDDCLAGTSSGCPANSGLTSTVQNGASFLPPMQISSEMFAAGGESDMELYFKVAMASQPANELTSNSLHAVNDPSQCSYPLPIAGITGPIHQGIYFANTQIDFAQGCTSPVELMNYQWTVTQGGQDLNLGQSATSANFQHSFVNTGQALIRLTCTGQTSGKSATAEAQILVVASPFVFAYISAPSFNAVVYNQPQSGQPYFATQAIFSASNSFAVDTNIQGSNCLVTCLAGNCPMATQNSPSSCTGTNGQAGGPLSVSGTPKNHNDMNFDWKFWDNNWNEPWAEFEGLGINSGAVAYDDLSNARNDKHMTLTATISGVSATFERDFTLGRCLNNGGTYLDSNGELLSTTVDAVPNACKGFDQLSPLDDCCPSGMVCQSVSGQFSCVVSQNPIDKCDDMTQSQCNNWANTNPQAPSNQMPNPTSTCSYLECVWNQNASNGQGSCGVHERNYISSIQGCVAPMCVDSDCTWSTSQTSCQNGQKTIDYIGTPISTEGISLCSPQNTCTPHSVTVPCGASKFELGFFNYIHFIVTAMVIALVYLVKGIRRRE